MDLAKNRSPASTKLAPSAAHSFSRSSCPQIWPCFWPTLKTTVVWGMTAGALAGVGWVAAGLGIIALFENRSWTYILVNGGYPRRGLCRDGRHPRRLAVSSLGSAARDSGLTAVVSRYMASQYMASPSSRSRTKERQRRIDDSITAGRSAPGTDMTSRS